MTKIYELAGKDRCQLTLIYCGLKRTVEFVSTGGATCRSQLKTTDRFLQDALEHDPRFGRLYKCVQKFDENAVVQDKKPVADAEERGGQTSRRAKTIISVKNLNQALNYFVRQGELPQTEEEVKTLMEKYNVSFPNWKDGNPDEVPGGSIAEEEL